MRTGRFARVGALPDHKPPYAEFLSAQDGRIWVRRRVEGYKLDDEETPAEESNRPPPISWEERRVHHGVFDEQYIVKLVVAGT